MNDILTRKETFELQNLTWLCGLHNLNMLHIQIIMFAFATRDIRNNFTLPCCTPNTMNVCIGIRRKIKVDHVGHELEVNSSSNTTFFIFHSAAPFFISVHFPLAFVLSLLLGILFPFFLFLWPVFVKKFFIRSHNNAVNTLVKLTYNVAPARNPSLVSAVEIMRWWIIIIFTWWLLAVPSSERTQGFEIALDRVSACSNDQRYWQRRWTFHEPIVAWIRRK